MAALLLTHMTDFEAIDKWGRPVLHCAAASGDIDAVRFLIEQRGAFLKKAKISLIFKNYPNSR
jgi:ankyrin repeat protein